MADVYNPPLQVMGYVATRSGDAERGPLIRMRADDAALRLVVDGELVWVQGPRYNEIATLQIDNTLARGTVVVRDILGITLSEIVRVSKPNYDAARGGQGRLV